MKTSGQSPGPDVLIYVVDDEEFIVKLVLLVLRQAGMRVRGFTNPHQALKAMRDEPPPPDLLITDFEMEPLNGVGLIRECLKFQPSLKAILVSGSAMDETEEAVARQVGMARFMIKPVPNDELVRAVREVLTTPTTPVAAWPSRNPERPQL